MSSLTKSESARINGANQTLVPLTGEPRRIH